MLYRDNLDLDVYIAVAEILSRLDIHDEGKHEGNVVLNSSANKASEAAPACIICEFLHRFHSPDAQNTIMNF